MDEMTDPSDPSEATVEDAVALPPPTGLTVTVVSPTRMDLAWNASAGATKYIILRGPSPGTETAFTSVAASPTTFAYNHLTPNTQYCWEVENLNAQNQVSGPSNEVCASTGALTPPNPPTGVTATATSSSRITVSWNAVAGATAYFVDMAQAPGSPTFFATVLPPATSLVVANLSPATTYNFDVRVQTASGTSAPSAVVTATTFALGLEGYWRLDEDAGTVANDISGFARTGTLSGGAAFNNDKPNVLNNKSTVDFPATGGKITIGSSASALNLVGTAYSVLLWVKIPVAAATVHFIGQRAASCGAIGWEIGQDAVNGLFFAAGSSVRRFGTTVPVGVWTHVAVTSDGTTETEYVNGVQTATGAITVPNHGTLPLTMGHVGDCAGGEVRLDEVQLYSRVLTPSEVAAFGKLPDPPVNLNVTVVSSTEQDLAWTAVPGAAKYLVYRGTAPGNETFFTSSPATTSTFKYGHLTPATQYSWQVAVVKATLFSNPSNEVVASTLAGPTAPTGVTATAVSSSRIRVNWNAVAGAVQYHVFKSQNGGPFTFAGTALSPATTFTVGGLASMTMYSFEVTAVDNGNTSSPNSAPASATTL